MATAGGNPSSIAAWNEYLKSFVNELCETFPECPDLFALIGVIDVMIDEDEHSVLEKFIAEIEPHTEALTNMDENFFLEGDIDFLKKLGAKKFWTPDLEQETKQAIWQYLQTLLVMGKTIQSVPPNMLRMLEDYASKITAQMGDGNVDPSQLDLQTLGLGALQHMQQGESSSVNRGGESGMFSNIFDNMSTTQQANLTSMGNLFAQNPLAAQMMAPNPTAVQPPPAGGGGGFDRLFGQFANQQQQQQQSSQIGQPGSVWGSATPPLYGHHPMFTNQSSTGPGHN